MRTAVGITLVSAVSFLLNTLPCALSHAAEQPLVLAEDGESGFVIYHAPDAVASVKVAAEELQRVIRIATGAGLAVTDLPSSRMIALGASPSAEAAGVSAESVPEDGFRIATHEGSVYIVGNDTPGSAFEWGTRWYGGLHYTHRLQTSRGGPKGAAAWGGGVSYGTLFGIYAFLEDVVGARWLMPGEAGEDIPRHAKLTVPPLSMSDAPDFVARDVMYVGEINGNREDVKQWKTRLRLGGSWVMRAGHIWHVMPPRDTLRANPEFMALHGDQRQPVPKGERHVYANGRRFQPRYCTTNPDLLSAFAGAVGTWVKERPGQRFFSVSPTDGSGHCQCETCSPYVLQGPDRRWGSCGSFNRSITPAILKFYNDVAKLVREDHPNRFVGGYAYYDYTYPPDEPFAVEPNVFIVLAPLRHYGLTRYKPHYEDEFSRLCEAWRRLTPILGYSDYPTWMRNGLGAPIGPSKPILKHTFAALKANAFKTVQLCGLQAWGYGALHNYTCAKLTWNADADVDALCREWLERAYGPAATAMETLYDLVDGKLAEYKRSAPESIHDYEMTSDLALNVYLANFGRIETLFRQAMARVETHPQRTRLEMFGDNLVVLHHVLDNAGVLENPEQSIFYRAEPDYRALLESRKDSLAIGDIKGVEDTGGITALLIPEKKQLTIPRIAAGQPRPKLDGDLSDPAWKQAAVADEFYRAGTKKAAAYATVVRVTFDADNLYLAFRCADDAVTGKPTARDSNGIYDGDVAEVLFNNAVDGAYWLLTVNPSGAQRDSVLGAGAEKLEADRPWQCVAAAGDGAWTVEVRLPFTAKEKELVAGGTAWAVNLIRMNRPKYERSYWTNVDRDIRDSREIGAWHFAGAARGP